MGIGPLGTAAFEMLRIEAGVPLYGRELSEQFNPLEAGLNHAISFAKGCYTGQEVIARLDTYQRLKQRLARFALTSLPSDEPPIPLLAESGEVGSLTSFVRLPAGNMLGLGYVRAKAFAEGATFKLGTHSDAAEATLISAIGTPAQGAR
jgi:tRNA-modifying protein YgfZ